MTKRKGFRRLTRADKFNLAEARRRALALREPRPVIKKTPLNPKKKEKPKQKKLSVPKEKTIINVSRSNQMKKWWRQHQIKKATDKALFLNRTRKGIKKVSITSTLTRKKPQLKPVDQILARSVQRRVQRIKHEMSPSSFGYCDVIAKKPNQEKDCTIEKSLKLKAQINMSKDQYRLYANMSNDAAPASEVEAARRTLYNQSGYQPIFDKSDHTEKDETNEGYNDYTKENKKQVIGLHRPLEKVIKEACEKAKSELQGSKIRVTLSGDFGGSDEAHSKSTKIIAFLNDVHLPCSVKNTMIVAIISNTDNYDNLKKYLPLLNEEVKKLMFEGVVIDKMVFKIEFFLVGDIKFLMTSFGLQSATATYPCVYCLIKKDELNTVQSNTLPKPREIEKMIEAANIIATANFKSATKKRNLQKNLGSIHAPPLIPAIPLLNVVPPPLHLISGCVKFILDVFKNESHELFDKAKVRFEKGRSELNGKDGQKLLNYILGLDDAEFNTDFFNALRATAKLMEISKVNYMFNDMEYVESVIYNVVQSLKRLRPLTPKIHIIECHLYPFIVNHKSWGRFSEQGTEAIHHVVNKDFLKVPAGSFEKRAKYFVTNQLALQLNLK